MIPEILYAENFFAVIVKPAGLLSTGEGDGTVPGALQNQLGTLYPVHRLDRVVGGVMVYARRRGGAFHGSGKRTFAEDLPGSRSR